MTRPLPGVASLLAGTARSFVPLTSTATGRRPWKDPFVPDPVLSASVLSASVLPSAGPRHRTRTTACLLLAGGLAVALAGCGSSSSATTPTAATSTSASSTAGTSSAAAGLSLEDGWVKAAPSGMTAIFGILTNPTGQDITVVSGTSPVAGMVQLHEVVTVNGTSTMRPKTGGIVVPAHGSHELKPGGDHIMVMDLRQPIKAGDTVTATLTLKDGVTVQVSAIGKDFAGANETYAPSGAGMSGGMSMTPGTSKSPGTSTGGGMGAPTSASS